MKVKKNRINNNLIGFLMAVIPIIGFILFSFIPIIISLGISFFELENPFIGLDLKAHNTFVFLKNYKYVLSDAQFLKSILHTLLFCLSIPFEILFGIITANFLNSKIIGKEVFRVIFFLPYICSVVAISIAWKILLNTEPGVINALRELLGASKNIEFLFDKKSFVFSIIMMTVWSVFGYDALLCQAAISNIDTSVYEAGRIDGCVGLKQLFYLTFPLITPTIFFLLVTSLIGGLQSFVRVHTMNLSKYTAGPDGVGLTMVYYIYSNFTGEKGVTPSLGYAISSAATMIVTVIIGSITVLNFSLSNKWVEYND